MRNLLLVVLLVVLIRPVSAQDPPRHLAGSFNIDSGLVELSWDQPVSESDWMEDFEDGFANSFQYDVPGNWTVSSGSLVGTNTPSGTADQFTGAAYEGTTFDDGIYEVELKRTLGSDLFSQCLFVRCSGPIGMGQIISGYGLFIAPGATEGHYCVFRYDGNTLTSLSDGWTLTGNLNLGNGARNALSVVADGPNLTFFLNGIETFACTDYFYSQGYIGVGFAEDFGVTGQVAVDYCAFDDGLAAAECNLDFTQSFDLPVDFQAALSPPASFPRARPSKTVVRGLLYENGEYIGEANVDELDDVQWYNVYRNGALLASPTETTFSETLFDEGVYDYTVTAHHNSGESVQTVPYTAFYLDEDMYILTEDFNDGWPAGWHFQFLADPSTGTWNWDHGDLIHSRQLFPTPYLLIDSDFSGVGVHMRDRYWTSEIDIDDGDFIMFMNSVYFREYIDEFLELAWSVDGGSTWNTFHTYDWSSAMTIDWFDLSDDLAGHPTVCFSWLYDDNGNWGWYAGLDDIKVYLGGQPEPVSLTLTPIVDQVPATGGQIVYDAHLLSLIPLTIPGLRYQTFATLPDGVTVFGPIDNLPFTLTPFMDYTIYGMSANVPAGAPAGVYIFEAIAGNPINPAQQVSDSFPFTKAGALGAYNEGDWAGSEVFISSDGVKSQALPVDYHVEHAYPNPFNPSTTIRVSLPEPAELTITAFNVMGQEVSVIASGTYTAGQHNLTFDAQGLASGLYFIHVIVPGQLNQTQKVMLVR